MTKHYTAVLKIHVTETKTAPQARYGHEAPPPAHESDEVVSLVLRAPSLEALQAKLAAHVALIEE